MQALLIDFICMSTDNKKCNPHFFQILFETQSHDLTTEVYTNKSVSPTITNSLECFVTAWCVANSDPTSQWLLEFNNNISLEMRVLQ